MKRIFLFLVISIISMNILGCRSKEPKTAEFYFDKGIDYVIRENSNRAIHNFSQAIKLDHKFAKAYLYRGYLYYKKNNLSQAFFDYNEVIKINPNYIQAYTFRADIYMRRNDFEKASSDYSVAIALDPENPEHYFNQGMADEQISFSKALADYSQAILINPNYADAYKKRANCYYHLSQYANCWKDVQRCEELNCRINPEFLNMLNKASPRKKPGEKQSTEWSPPD